jgi:hypothetical protein
LSTYGDYLERPPLGARRQKPLDNPTGAAVDQLDVDPAGRGLEAHEPSTIRLAADAGLGAVIELDEAGRGFAAEVRDLHTAKAPAANYATRKGRNVDDGIFADVLFDDEDPQGLPESQPSALGFAVNGELATQVAGEGGLFAPSHACPVHYGHENLEGGAGVSCQMASGLMLFAVVMAKLAAPGFTTIITEIHIRYGTGVLMRGR